MFFPEFLWEISNQWMINQKKMEYIVYYRYDL